MPYPNQQRNQGGTPQGARQFQPRQNSKWTELQATEEIHRQLGQDYVNSILSVRKDDYNTYIDKVKKYMQENARNISTSQIRNIFSRIRSIQNYHELALLRPKLAYISGREERNDAMKTMLYLLDRLMVAVDSEEKLRQFQDFFEAVVAYHKYWGGKN